MIFENGNCPIKVTTHQSYKYIVTEPGFAPFYTGQIFSDKQLTEALLDYEDEFKYKPFTEKLLKETLPRGIEFLQGFNKSRGHTRYEILTDLRFTQKGIKYEC